jgi:hypothetical protein
MLQLIVAARRHKALEALVGVKSHGVVVSELKKKRLFVLFAVNSPKRSNHTF